MRKFTLQKKLVTILVFLTLSVIPLITLTSSLNIVQERQDEWYGSGYDPSYAYLYNSLNVARFRLVGHFDHPGTPMQIIGGVILQTSWMIHPYGGSNLTEAVLTEPEYYLHILNTSVAVIGSLALLIAGFLVFLFTGNIWYGLLTQSTPYISGIILFNGFVRISQESMLMISSIALGVALIFWYFRQSNYSQKYFMLVFAIISGFGLASKIIFAPLLLIPLYLLEKRLRLKYLKFSGISFIVFTLPIIPLYPNMAWWFIKLFIHSGIYGKGSSTVIDFHNYFISLQSLIVGERVYLYLLIITLIALITQLLRHGIKALNNRPGTKLLLAIFITQIIGFLITAKHPKLAYLLPYECLSTVSLIIILDSVLSPMHTKWLKQSINALIVLGIVVFMVRYGTQEKSKLYSSSENELYQKALSIISDKGSKHAVIGINPGPSPIAAMFFANVYSRERYSKDLEQLYPDDYIFDSYKDQLTNWNFDKLSLDALISKYNGNVLMIGDDAGKDLFQNSSVYSPEDYQLTNVWSGGSKISVWKVSLKSTGGNE
jgi:hypothetical protein